MDEEYQLLVRLQPDMFVVEPDRGEDSKDGDHGANTSNGNGTGGDVASSGTGQGPGAIGGRLAYNDDLIRGDWLVDW